MNHSLGLKAFVEWWQLTSGGDTISISLIDKIVFLLNSCCTRAPFQLVVLYWIPLNEY